MNPLTREVARFQDVFREFRSDPAVRVLRIEVAPEDLGPLTQTIRGEEWHPDNMSPFLVFTQPYEEGGAVLAIMAEHVVEHYRLLREGLAKEDAAIPEFGPPARTGSPFRDFQDHLERFTRLTAGVLDPPLVCWIVAIVSAAEEFAEVVRTLVERTHGGVRFLLADDPERPCFAAWLEEQPTARTERFHVDPAAVQDHFKRLHLASPREGRAPGAPPGAAAPNARPPAAPGPTPPSDEQVRAALMEKGLPPMLTPDQGETLQRLIFDAAQGAGAGDEERALRRQFEAYTLCRDVGVRQEESAMALVLAGYLVQFRRDHEGLEWFGRAADVASEVDAHAHASQALMGQGYVHFKLRQYEEAAQVYERAAEAAERGDVALLVLENWRMAGVCHRLASRADAAIAAWMQGVERARTTPPAELELSNYEEMLEQLKSDLCARGARYELAWVLAAEHEIRVAGDGGGAAADETAEKDRGGDGGDAL